MRKEHFERHAAIEPFMVSFVHPSETAGADLADNDVLARDGLSSGRQRTEKGSGRPMWQTQVFEMDETGGEVIMVTTVGEKPSVHQGQLVQLVQLEAIPWSMETNGKARSGVSFRAVEIKPVEVRSAGK